MADPRSYPGRHASSILVHLATSMQLAPLSTRPMPTSDHPSTPPILPADWPAADPSPPPATEAAIRRAADLLAAGGLVAIPTETVYGLAAVADDPRAVAAIYEAKGRPPENPLIVHVANTTAARELVTAFPPSAERIAAAFWPGPVTIVLPKSPRVPDIVTAGGPTVALRCPAHRVTRRLLELLGRPIAAPSGNRSGCLSPTTAAHVAESLGGRIDLVLDGGRCDRGIESTVIDLCGPVATILRPGPVSAADLAATLGEAVRARGEPGDTAVLRSPGLLARHYAPRAKLVLGDGGTGITTTIQQWLAAGERVGWITRGPPAGPTTAFAAGDEPRLRVAVLPDEPEGFARDLYACLHDLDAAGVDRIVVDPLPDDESWQAVADRLGRATEVPRGGSPGR